MHQSINHSLAALLLGVVILVMAGCESSTPVEALNEQREGTTPELLTQLGSDSLAAGELFTLEPDFVDPSEIPEELLKILEKRGINPDSLIDAGSFNKENFPASKKARESYLKDQELDTVRMASTPQSITFTPEDSGGETQMAMSGEPTPASTEFIVTDGHGSPASGSITVRYDGELVTTPYTSFDNTFSVASMISHKINDDPDIQLTSIVSGTEVTVTEKRPGCEFNGNLVHISFSAGTHIAVNDSDIHLEGGTDDGVGCPPPDVLPAPQLLSPPDDTLNQAIANLTLDWAPVEEATSYELQMATDVLFNDLVLDETGITSTAVSVSELELSTIYYWRVRAANAEEVSGWSTIWGFATLHLEAASHVDTPLFGDFGNVILSSVSKASVPIEQIFVVGESFRNNIPLTHPMMDSGSDIDRVAVHLSVFKEPGEPESTWKQEGGHIFNDQQRLGEGFGAMTSAQVDF